MNILITGSGAKEYSLAKLISSYENVNLVFVAPGNYAVSEFATCVDIESDDVENLIDFVKANDIDLTIVSDENPIFNNIAERFNEEGLMIFSPTMDAARFALSKSIGKKFMYKTKIPTSKFGIFDRESVAVDYARKSKYPLIIKSDFHMDGENVYYCESFKIAKNIISELFDTQHKKVIIEDYVAGQEFSYYIITDGYNAMPIASVVPYKHTLEGNGGHITSGVGAYSPFYMIDSSIERRIFNEIVYPALDELAKSGNQYVGILGIDVILDRSGNLSVVEFNTFINEPDIQCVLSLLDENIVDLMKAAIVGSLVDDFMEIRLKPQYSASLVLSSGNYPSVGRYGEKIEGLDEANEFTEIAHFNTRKDNNSNFFTAGGRTLVLTSNASTLQKAVDNLYESAAYVKFDSKKCRKDIGKTHSIGC